MRALSIIIVAFLVSSCSPTNEAAKKNLEQSRYGGVYRRVMIDEPFSLDPKEFNDRNSIMIANQIYDRLIKMDADFNIVPSIATEWRVSKDRMTYVFTIRDDVYFHNGEKLSADDIVFSIGRLNSGGALISKYLKIVKVNKRSEREVKIQLQEPFPPILLILASANASIISKKYYEALGDDYFKKPIGTGPFCFESWERGKRIVLRSNESYFSGRPYLDRVVYYKLTQEEAEKRLVEGTLEDMAPYRMTDKHSDRGMKNIFSPTLQTNIIFFNSKHKPFNDVRVRKAFIYAFNKEKLYKVVGDYGRTHAKGYVPRGIIGYDPNFEDYGYDIAKAKELLAQAGYPDGKGIGKITLIRPKSYPHKAEFARLIRKFYRDIGVDVEVKHVEFQEIIKSHLNNTSQMVNCEINLDLPETFFSLTYFHSNYKFNFTNVNNKRLDELLDRVLLIDDKRTRAGMYAEIDKIICQDEALLINVYYDDYFDGFYKDYVHGVTPSLLGVVYMNMDTVWIDKQKQRTYSEL